MNNQDDDTGLTAEGLKLLLADPASGIKEYLASDYLKDPESIAAYLALILHDVDD